MLDGRYRVAARVGKGGMGSVYRADDQKLKRVVAIKVMNEHVPDELGSRRRFEREAQAMAMLEHPHCASILDVGMHDGYPYVVMDFIAGQSLDELLAGGPVPIPRAVELTRQILFGLAHAHEHGIIHRDIKPANIVFSQKAGMGDHVKILDFGLAKIGQETSNLTAGFIVGTPSYMAPEQIRGLLLDGRADVYACGALLFELLTGKKPYQAPNNDPLAICMMHLSDPVPRLADKLAGRDFGALEDIIAHALAKDREHRFGSAMAFANALANVVPSRVTPTSLVAQAQPDTNATAALDPMVSQVTRAMAPVPIATEWVPDQAPRSQSTVALEEGDLMSVPRPPVIHTPVPRPAEVRSPVAWDSNPVALPSPPGGWQHAGVPGRSRKRLFIAVGSLCAIALIAIVVVAARSSTTSTPATGSARASKPASGESSATREPSQPASDKTPDPSDWPQSPESASPPTTEDAPPVVAPPPRPGVPSDDPVAKIIAQADQHLARRWREGAIDVLVKGRRTHPNDPRLPYRAGLLYLEKMWWPDGLKQLRAALALDPNLRNDPTLIRAAVRAFTATAYVDWTLAKFLRTDIGDTARPILEDVAAKDRNPVVRNRARAELARSR